MSGQTSESMVTAPEAPAPVVATAPHSARIRIRESVSLTKAYSAYWAQRLGTTGVVGVSMCVFSAFAFLTANLPLHEAVRDQATALNNVRSEGGKSRTGPTNHSAKERTGEFVRGLPMRSDIPGVIGSIVAVATTVGIELERGTYEYVKAENESLARYRMAMPVTGSYPQIRRFVEDTLATVPALTLDTLRIERGSVAEPVIEADLRFSILLGDQT